MRILIADDERGIRMTLEDDLVDAGHTVSAVGDGEAAWRAMQKHEFDMLVADIVMPKMDGLELLENVRRDFPNVFTITITGNSSDERNRKAVALGVNYYLEKPFSNEQVVLLAREAEEKAKLAAKVRERTNFQSLVGGSPKMQRIFEQIRTISESDFAVLVTGPSGSGKERVANLIHANSPRADAELIVVHCGMYAETLIEDELFGHEVGAYTGASAAREGRFERANGGTIFLDDIDDMPIATQVKLLRVLQEGEIERLGGSKTIPVDVRVIASTKVDLAKMVAKGTFREDLYYRLNVIPLELPPLVERIGDVPILIDHFIKMHGKARKYSVGADEMAKLEAHPWPGNVRELENAVKRAIALAGSNSELSSEHMLGSRPRVEPLLPDDLMPKADDARPLKEVMERVEHRYILEVYKVAGYSKKETAEALGISRKNLWEKMKKYGIEE